MSPQVAHAASLGTRPAYVGLILYVVDLLLRELRAGYAMPRLACFAHDEVALVALLALATLVSLLRVRVVTLLAEALSVLQPNALRDIRDYG